MSMRYQDPNLAVEAANFSKLMQLLPLISILITANFPAGFNLYMLIFSSFQFAQINFLRVPYFQKVFLKDEIEVATNDKTD